MLSVAFVLPFIGWFMVLPLTLLSGVGAAVVSLRKKADKEDVQRLEPGVDVAGT